MNQKPQIFIGSSSEGRVIAGAIQAGLTDIAECTVWDQGIFELGRSTLDGLYDFLEDFEFAIFIAAPDDNVEIRGKSQTSARDNVIFEIGLFMGGLGTDRVMFVTAGDIKDFRLPSDLAGITHAKYDNSRVEKNIYAAVGPACLALEQHIKKKSKTPRRTKEEELIYCGAICFRIRDDDIEYLLVYSTQGRKIFPKGSRDQKNAEVAAARIAKREGGVRGRIIETGEQFIKYYNDEEEAIHRMQIFLMNVSIASGPQSQFREPEWYNLTEAITALTKDRDYNTSFELVRIMEWADDEIRILAGLKSKYKKGSKRKQKSAD